MLCKESLGILARSISVKTRKAIGIHGGTRLVLVEAALRGRAPLDDARIVALGRLTLSLEKTLGIPVDVECAFRDDDLWLLQCRPITTLP